MQCWQNGGKFLLIKLLSWKKKNNQQIFTTSRLQMALSNINDELSWWLSAPPANAGDAVQSLGWEDPLEKEMATHSGILAWEIPWTEEPGRL